MMLKEIMINGKKFSVIIADKYQETHYGLIPAWYLRAENGLRVTPNFYSKGDKIIEKLTNFVTEEANKLVSWWELFGAECVIGDGATENQYFETEVRKFAESLKDIQPVTDKDEFETAKEKLFLVCYDIKRIFRFTRNGEKGYFVLKGDYETYIRF